MPMVLCNNKLPISLERMSYVLIFLHVVGHSWKLQFDNVIFVEYSLNFFELTNQQYGFLKKFGRTMDAFLILNDEP